MDSELRYLRLYDLLRKDIATGVYPIGKCLPSENELVAAHGVARSTVRLALAKLEREGMIEKRKGMGSIIKSPRKSLGLLSFHGFSQSMALLNQTVQTEVLQPLEIATFPTAEVQTFLNEEATTESYHFTRIRKIENVPIMHESTWLPTQHLPNFNEKYSPENSLFEFLFSQYNIEVIDMCQQIKAVNAMREVAHLLALDKSAAVLLIFRKYITNKSGFAFYSLLHCNTERFSLSNTSPTVYNSEQ